MDEYGLTKYEQMTNLHEYNHALFHNMKVFLDATWEINLKTSTVFMIYEAMHPDHEGIQYEHENVLREFGEQYVSESDRKLWYDLMCMDSLRRIRDDMTVELHLRNHNGIPELFRIFLTPGRNEKGVVEWIYLSAKNIEEGVRRLRLLERQKQNIFAAMSSTFPCVMYVNLTQNTYDIHISEKMDIGIPMNGVYTVAFHELLKSTASEFQFEYAQKFSQGSLIVALNATSALVEMESRQMISGAMHWVSIRAIRIPDEDTSDVCAVVLVFMIDAQKENERLAQIAVDKNDMSRRTLSKEEQYRRAIVSGSVFVYNVNLSRNLIEDEIYEVVDGERYPVLEKLGLSLPCNYDQFSETWAREKVLDEDRVVYLETFNRDRLLDEYNRGKMEITVEYRTKAMRNIYMILQKTLLLIRDSSSGDILALCNARDVTEQRERERKTMTALQESLQVAEMANSAKTDFLSRMSHDMRTPMNAIIGMTSIAREHMGDIEQMTDCLDSISNSSEYLLGLINEVLDMSKIELGKVELTNVAFDLKELLDDVLLATKDKIEKKNHTMDVNIHDLKYEKLIGDIVRIREILLNVLDNAIKYTPDGGKIKLSVTETESSFPNRGHFEFVVEDNGIGMSQDFLGCIFDMFARAVDTRVNQVEGSGLGMPIAKNLVALMDGDIKVESEIDKGTKVTVDIYLTKQKSREGKRNARPQVKQKPDFSGNRVLIVEDNKANAKVAAGILHLVGIDTECVENGRDAIDLLLEREPGYFDLILMDIQMPVMNGYEAARLIRAQSREDLSKMPIIALSANAYQKDIQESFDSGMNQHIAKPINTMQLMTELQKWLNIRKI